MLNCDKHIFFSMLVRPFTISSFTELFFLHYEKKYVNIFP